METSTQASTVAPGSIQTRDLGVIILLLSIDYSQCRTCGLKDLYCEDTLSDVDVFFPVATLSELECSVLCNLLNLWSDSFSDYYQDYTGQEMTERRLRCENYVWFDSRHPDQPLLCQPRQACLAYRPCPPHQGCHSGWSLSGFFSLYISFCRTSSLWRSSVRSYDKLLRSEARDCPGF